MFKFSLGRKKEEPGVQPVEAEKEQKRDAAVSDTAAYAESVTPVPAVELIPPRWSRRRIISMVKIDEMSQSSKVIATVLCMAGLAAAVCGGCWMWNSISQNKLKQQETQIGELISQYDRSISRASGMNGILEYTQELSLAEQARAIVNLSVSSGIVAHSMELTHNPDAIPSNVRNSFETTTSLKLDNVHIHGIWIVDGSFTREIAGTTEQWILSTNKTFASMFQGTRFSTFLDMSSRAGAGRGGANRYELVYMFWSPAESRGGSK